MKKRLFRDMHNCPIWDKDTGVENRAAHNECTAVQYNKGNMLETHLCT